MRKIINGKVYDTTTADEICEWGPSGLTRNDFHWWTESLYRTKKGAWFVAGEGGALSKYRQPHGNGSIGGEDLRLVTEDEARALVEQHARPERYAELFGEPEEG